MDGRKERGTAPPTQRGGSAAGQELGHLRFVPTHGAVESRQSEFFRHQLSVCGAPKCHKGAAWATFLSLESEEGEVAEDFSFLLFHFFLFHSEKAEALLTQNS